MKRSFKKRLLKLETSVTSKKKHRIAKVVCDPDVWNSLDLSQIEAEVLLILPAMDID
jgi:hypothetical protein